MSTDRSRRTILRAALFGALGSAVWAARPAMARQQEPVAKPPPAKKPRLRPALKYSMIAVPGSIQDKLALVRELGFEGVEIDSPLEIDREAVCAARDATGIVIHGVIDSIHWQTRFSDPDPAVRAKAVKALEGAIDDCKLYGGTTVLVVPGVVGSPDVEGFDHVWQRSQAEIRKVLPRAKAAGVKISIEVVWNGFITKPEELVKYVDEFADPTVGAYFDCSNMIKFGVSGAEWIRKLGPRLQKIDFKGYSKSKGWVKIGEGDEDWPEISKALVDIGYDGWITAEVESGGREHLADVKKRMDRVLGVEASAGR